jgi:hypothetical protein
MCASSQHNATLRLEDRVPEQLLSPKEARQRAKMGVTRFRDLLAADPPPFPVIKFNRRFWRIRERDLDGWIAAGCPVAPEAAVTARALTLRERRKSGTDAENGGRR